MAALVSSSTTSVLEEQFKQQNELLQKRTAELEKLLDAKSAEVLVMTQIIQNLQN